VVVGAEPQVSPRRSAEARQAMLVGILIVLVSVFGAYVTWRAAAASGTAADLDQGARQARILEAQVRAENAAIISFEQRVFTTYADHLALADQLDRDAAGLRTRRPAEAELLTARAQRERALARSMLPLFYAATPHDSEQHPRFQREAATRFLDADPRLTDLRPGELEEAAAAGRRKRFWLVAVDTVLIASIFFSTLALLGASMRRRLAAAGIVLSIVAAVAFIVVTIVVEVPAA
jgi:hypothetical protein